MDPLSFPFFSLTLFPSLSLSSLSLFKYKWRALKKKLSSKCWSPCCISHSGSMSHQPHTCWKCVPRIIGACASFPRLQVIIGLSGLHVAWCSTGSERCLWQQKRIQILKAALEGLAQSTCWAVSSWPVLFIWDKLIYFPVTKSRWFAFFIGAYSFPSTGFVVFLWGTVAREGNWCTWCVFGGCFRSCFYQYRASRSECSRRHKLNVLSQFWAKWI